jgi:hypothetical protein
MQLSLQSRLMDSTILSLLEMPDLLQNLRVFFLIYNTLHGEDASD